MSRRGENPTPAPRGEARASAPRLRRRAALREAAYLVGILATAGVAYGALVVLPSKLKTRELRQRRDRLRHDTAELRASISELQAETAALRDDPWTVERELRGRLGYLRPGERVLEPPPEPPPEPPEGAAPEGE